MKSREAGNIFFALFGAVAFVGVLGAATMSFIKGPLKTSVTISRMSIAQTQMQVALQMGVLQASTEEDSGDCDSDGFVEPIEWKDQATATLKPVGGGNIPDTLGASKNDPWGQFYGYCVWNSGTNVTIGGVAACDDDSSGTEDRLEGSPNNYDVVMAVVSAGPDRTFQTTCQTFDAADANDNLVLGDVGDTEMIFKAGGSDDVILAYTYAEAATVGGGGLWSIKSSDPGTATIDKAIEFTGGLTMGTEIDVTVCSFDTLNQMRYNGVTDVIQVCDGSSWVDLSGGGDTISDANNDTKIQVEEAINEDKIRFDTDGSERMIIDEQGQVGIGASPVSRAVTIKQLNNGEDALTIIRNTDTSWSGNYLTVRNASDTANIFSIGPISASQNPRIAMGNLLLNSSSGCCSTNGITSNAAGLDLSIEGSGEEGPQVSIFSKQWRHSPTSGHLIDLLIGRNESNSQSTHFAPSSGAAEYSMLNVRGKVGQLGSSTGTTRGIYIEPSIIGAYDHRALEISGYTHNILGTPPTTLQQVLFNAPTFAAGAATTLTNAATHRITGAPIAGTNVTITNPYSLWIEDGVARFDGDIEYTGLLTDVSDIRMKENIKPLENSLDKIKTLEGINFTMRGDDSGSVELGFSAQDVQKVYPELVKKSADDVGSLSMNYIGLLAPLVESVKELEIKNKNLEIRLGNLERQATTCDQQL